MSFSVSHFFSISSTIHGWHDDNRRYAMGGSICFTRRRLALGVAVNCLLVSWARTLASLGGSECRFCAIINPLLQFIGH